MEASEQDPRDEIEELRNSPFLALLLEHPEKVSTKSIEVEQLVSTRQLDQGYGEVVSDESEGLIDTVLFREYVLDHAGHYGLAHEDDHRELDYEAEYLIGGGLTDKDNLEAVSERLMLMREAVNFSYLLTDTGKQAEAEALAIAVAGYSGLPPLITAVKWALLLAWAFGESVIDVRTLLAGKRIPLIKTSETWELELGNLAMLKSDTFYTGKDCDSGYDYTMFLRCLLYTGNTNEQTYRFMDVMEQQIRNTQGNDSFRMDACLTGLTIGNVWTFSRGIRYSFPITYNYQ